MNFKLREQSSFIDLDRRWGRVGLGVDELIAWVPQYWMPYLANSDMPYASIVCRAKGKRYVPPQGNTLQSIDS